MKPQKELFEQEDNSTPFLRWAGGKGWLVPHMKKVLEQIEVNVFHEPFLGGGAIFFGLFSNKLASLSDINGDLINCYRMVKENPNGLIEILDKMVNTKENYLRVRSEDPKDPLQAAARFIFLNRTAFNGIYRVNKSGQFNVPYGRPEVIICEREKLLKASRALSSAEIFECDFYSIDRYRSGDLVFLDPPYSIGTGKTFVQYNSNVFSLADQKRLASMLEEFQDRGIYYVLSNSYHPEVLKVFNECAFRIEISRREFVAADPTKRGMATELIFSNIEGLYDVVQ